MECIHHLLDRNRCWHMDQLLDQEKKIYEEASDISDIQSKEFVQISF